MGRAAEIQRTADSNIKCNEPLITGETTNSFWCSVTVFEMHSFAEWTKVCKWTERVHLSKPVHEKMQWDNQKKEKYSWQKSLRRKAQSAQLIKEKVMVWPVQSTGWEVFKYLWQISSQHLPSIRSPHIRTSRFSQGVNDKVRPTHF